MLQDRIKKNEKYFRGMEIINNTVIIKVLYGDKWGAYGKEDGSIKVAKSEEIPNEWFYYADYDYNAIDLIFDLIEETIDMNLSAIQRIDFFNEKMEELKEICSNTPLNILKTLTFQMSEEKKSKRKNTRKSKKDKDRVITATLYDSSVQAKLDDNVEVVNCNNELIESEV